MKTFRKAYTRDNGLIVQETWSYAFEEGFEKSAGVHNPHSPTLIYHVVEGMTDIWEQDEAFAWFKDSLLALNEDGPSFFEGKIVEYEKLMQAMDPYRRKDGLALQELKNLVDLLYDASRLFVILYYTSYDGRTPQALREKALAWRAQDEMYDTYEKVIKHAIGRLFPQAEGIELVVTVRDLDHMPSEEELRRRFREAVFVGGKPIETITLTTFGARHPEYTIIDEKPTKAAQEGTLKGQVASPGKARGKARILRRKAQVGELQEGEILISPMTTPDFVPAMRKAAAIVTDEGGITCHAAIFSREIRKPCIIGTRHATQVFKDGDMIEVDADNGIVRKLS